MATQETLDKHGNRVIINSPDDIAVSASGTGFDLTRAGGLTEDTIRFNEIDSTTNNPKIEVVVNGTTVQTIELNKNDINIDAAGSDFDLTDDELNFKSEDGSDNIINFGRYNITATANASGDVEISQNGNLLATIKQNASGIAYDPTDSTLTSTDVKTAIDDLDAKIENIDGGTEQQDDYVATVGQTAFVLTNAPIGQANIIRNGVTLAKASIGVAGTAATYVPAQNGANAMVAGDRVSITYQY